MQAISKDILASNAYRTLGVSGSATQAEIDSAARRMRIWTDQTRIPPTDWDAPWLGPIARTRSDIERAVAALNEPGSRIEHRLLWYQAGTVVEVNEGAAESLTSATMATCHDRALRALHLAFTTDPQVADLERWRSAVKGVSSLASSPEYAAWLARIEEEGNFEKRASAAELYSAVDALPEAVLATLVPKAQAALDRDDLEAGGQIALLLTEGGGGKSKSMRLLLDRLEDSLDQQCREIDCELRDKLRTRYDNPRPFYEQNRWACHDAANFYNQTLAVSLDRFLKIARDEKDRAMRARVRCAQVLALLAMGWEWAGRFLKAAQTQRVAMGLAEGSAGEAAIRKDLQRYEALAATEEVNAGSWDNSEKSWLRIGQQTPEGNKWRDVIPTKKSGQKSWISVAILATFLVRALISLSNSSSNSSSNYPGSGFGTYPLRPPARIDQSGVGQNPAPADPSSIFQSSNSPDRGIDISKYTPSLQPNASDRNDPSQKRPIDSSHVNDPFGETSRER